MPMTFVHHERNAHLMPSDIRRTYVVHVFCIPYAFDAHRRRARDGQRARVLRGARAGVFPIARDKRSPRAAADRQMICRCSSVCVTAHAMRSLWWLPAKSENPWKYRETRRRGMQPTREIVLACLHERPRLLLSPELPPAPSPHAGARAPEYSPSFVIKVLPARDHLHLARSSIASHRSRASWASPSSWPSCSPNAESDGQPAARPVAGGPLKAVPRRRPRLTCKVAAGGPSRSSREAPARAPPRWRGGVIGSPLRCAPRPAPSWCQTT